MKILDRVTWTTAAGVHGSGLVVATGNFFNGTPHWYVAVDAAPGEEHRVIYCAETWLTLVSDEGSASGA